MKDIICYEFGFTESDFRSLFVKKKTTENYEGETFFTLVAPKLIDMKKVFSETESQNQNAEPLPEYNFESINQKIAWLNELGIIKKILIDTSNNGNPNFYRTANIISSFTDINPDTIRRSIEAIYKPNKSNAKNNPLKNKENQLFVETMKVKFKIAKQKED